MTDVPPWHVSNAHAVRPLPKEQRDARIIVEIYSGKWDDQPVAAFRAAMDEKYPRGY